MCYIFCCGPSHSGHGANNVDWAERTIAWLPLADVCSVTVLTMVLSCLVDGCVDAQGEDGNELGGSKSSSHFLGKLYLLISTPLCNNRYVCMTI